MELRTDGIEPCPGRRGGLAGWIDGIRDRAEARSGRGMPDREAALARGFVLGEDDRIDPGTRRDFQRSNLTHLLAVSGENVILLCVLAWPLLALLGLRLRARLIGALCLIAIYVPVTGAGPSIQRAGVMGAAGLVAALADRPRSRWYAVLLAAAITLAVNPLAEGDVGWQLSFAAVIGILLWSGRLATALAGSADRRSVRRALIDGVAVTVSATVATAPLMAEAFDQFSPAAIPANVLAAPAVAPAMWLGMLTGILGQLPLIPVEPLNWLDSLCLAYIAQIAHWLASPDWALLTVHLRSVWSVAGAYAGSAPRQWSCCCAGSPTDVRCSDRARDRPGVVRTLGRPAVVLLTSRGRPGRRPALAIWRRWNIEAPGDGPGRARPGRGTGRLDPAAASRRGADPRRHRAAGRPRRGSAPPARDRPAGGDRDQPRSVRSRRRSRRAARLGPSRPRRLRMDDPRLRAPRWPLGLRRSSSPRMAAWTPARSTSARSGRPGSSSTRRAGIRTCSAWSWWPAGGTSRSFSPATPRPRPCRWTPARSTC